MSELPPNNHDLDLRRAAAILALAIGMVALAALLFYLIDILLILFLGIVVAAALQPWHSQLSKYGVPRGVAILLIYLLLLGGLVLFGLLIGGPLIEQLTAFASIFPSEYSSMLTSLRGSRTQLLRIIGQRLPPFEALVGMIAGVAPTFYESLVEFTTALVEASAYFVAVLAVAFYWTMELPRLERLLLSFVPVARRAEVLDIWHEIEFKLGAFIRGQGLAMLIIGAASGIGYALIGLPNVLALAVLAGLFEAVPLIGPVLAAVPAILVALPLGLTSVLLVIAWSILLQGVENNYLIPRIMSRAVGVSAPVGILAVLAFGTLYGVLGVFVAIPLTAVLQVLLDRMVINVEAPPEAPAEASPVLAELRTRVTALQRQVRRRFRERDTRVGIDPRTPDHVVDATDQQLEKAVERVATVLTTAESAGAIERESHAEIIRDLHEAIAHLEEAVNRVDTIVSAVEDAPEQGSRQDVELPVGELHQTTQKAEHAVGRVENVIASTQEAVGPPPTKDPSQAGGRGTG